MTDGAPILDLAGLPPAPLVALAVSGGGDSMAMLSLYEARRAAGGPLPPPLVLTVDHGLRPGFEDEAALVADWCGARGLAHRLLAWRGPHPATGVMAAARAARYRLLADACRAAGAPVLMTAHTLDDRRETAAMRAARGATAFAGLERLTLLERDILLVRPLLSALRDDLRGWLAASGTPHAEDPTNGDPRHERARVRRMRPRQREATLMAAQAGRADAARAAARWLARTARRDGDTLTIAAGTHDASSDPAHAALALRFLAAALAASPYPASPSAGLRLAALAAPGTKEGAAFTVMRLRFERRRGEVTIGRDPRHPAAPPASGRVAPFEAFCPASMLPLAGALARLLGAPAFPDLDPAETGAPPKPASPSSPCGESNHWQSPPACLSSRQDEHSAARAPRGGNAPERPA